MFSVPQRPAARTEIKAPLTSPRSAPACWSTRGLETPSAGTTYYRTILGSYGLPARQSPSAALDFRAIGPRWHPALSLPQWRPEGAHAKCRLFILRLQVHPPGNITRCSGLSTPETARFGHEQSWGLHWPLFTTKTLGSASKTARYARQSHGQLFAQQVYRHKCQCSTAGHCFADTRVHRSLSFGLCQLGLCGQVSGLRHSTSAFQCASSRVSMSPSRHHHACALGDMTRRRKICSRSGHHQPLTMLASTRQQALRAPFSA